MKLQVIRYNSAENHTNSLLLINGRFECYGLEDEFRHSKVYGETRIPDGKYYVDFRRVGGFHNRYKRRFGSWHKGMLEIQDVPNFKYVLIHIGNTDEDTSACYLVGDTNSRGENFISNSASAYKRLYPKVRNALLQYEVVEIEFKTIDKAA